MNKDKKVTIGDMQANDASVKKKCNEASSHPTIIFIHVTSMHKRLPIVGKGWCFDDFHRMTFLLRCIICSVMVMGIGIQIVTHPKLFE